MTTDTEVCRHHWRIAQGISPQVGRCTKCGESRLFATNLEGALRTNAKGKPLNQVGTQVRGMDATFVLPWEPQR